LSWQLWSTFIEAEFLSGNSHGIPAVMFAYPGSAGGGMGQRRRTRIQGPGDLHSKLEEEAPEKCFYPR
jgi:hypothetical protein